MLELAVEFSTTIASISPSTVIELSGRDIPANTVLAMLVTCSTLKVFGAWKVPDIIITCCLHVTKQRGIDISKQRKELIEDTAKHGNI